MSKFRFISYLFLATLFSCSRSPTKIGTPSYIRISNYYTKVDTLYGTNNQDFTDMLMLSTTDNLGIFPLGSNAPLPFTGVMQFQIRPVININGLSALKIDYPMMRSCDTTLPLVPGQVLNVRPVFEYYPNVHFRFLENFEGHSFLMTNENPSDTFGFRIDTAVAQKFYGSQASMLLQMNSANQGPVQTRSYQAFLSPNNGTPVYLEFNYMSNISIDVRVVAVSNATYNATTYSDIRSIGGALPSNGVWKKMYMDLTPVVTPPPIYYPSYFFIDFVCYYESAPYSYANIDNIKIISQQ